ncbi:MAG: hypothetical protein IRZ31_18365 [Thermogemmatispora sp.]|uniref:hypothetical protein n=1 Tax=Thermogemmatispora sp. TaxID=1968838 RepID=UPI002625B564|nr:hypothetical protein [Thermogemmatispora sp.]MBX5458862.1 hypothetical protein [Thermogemmatispora sp.]
MRHIWNWRRWLALLVPLALMLAACGGSAPTQTSAPAGAQTVAITERDFAIQASLTTFKPDVPYHFVITNQGVVAHEFMIMPHSMGSMAQHMSMDEMDHMALAMVENIPSGATVTLDYTFPRTAAGSHPEFACFLPGHYEAGMKLTVSVQS